MEKKFLLSTAASTSEATRTIIYNDDGILVHRYGPHIFHTNSEQVFQYLSQFTSWRCYEHRVLASVDGNLFRFLSISTP